MHRIHKIKKGSHYEGKEHMQKYKEPVKFKHKVKVPEDEPHMKSRVSKQESHEMEDNYHMGIPDDTENRLPKRIPRAHMKMEDEHPYNELMGNLVSKDGKPIRDDDGQERMGPKMMQEDEHEKKKSKEHRKSVAIAVISRKLKNKK